MLTLSLVPASAAAQIVTAPGPGQSPAVRVLETDGRDRTIMAYHPAFLGGVSVAFGDVNADGVLDIITGAGPGGGPHVRVWNGVDHTEIGGFFAYHPAFPGGVWVAAGDVDGDGHADIITGAGAGGGPHVRIWSGATFAEIHGFFAYHPAFPGGVRVAAGDVNGDGLADIITGAGPGGGPHVRVWNAAGFGEIGGFFAYSGSFSGGVFVAAGDVDGDGLADIITGPGAGSSPNVRIRSGATFGLIGNFIAYYDPAFTGGLTVGAVDLNRDRRVEIIVGPGAGAFPITSIFDGATLTLMGSYFAYDAAFRGGVFIGSVGSASPLRFTSADDTAFTVGAAGTFTVTTTGGGSSRTLSVSGALPSGVAFTDNGNGTATLAGTPDPGTAGTYNLTFTATPAAGTPVAQSFTLSVRQAPAITSGSAATFDVGVLGTFTITTSGVPSPAISASGALPSGVTFTDNGNGTATITGTPASGTGGTYPLVITASNGVGSAATQNFTLTVQQAASITSANAATFTVGAAGSFTITTVGSPTVTSIVQGGALPSGVAFTNNGNGTATLAGMPAASTGGTYNLTFTAANGVGSPAVQNFTLTIQQAPAVTSASSATFTIGVANSFTVTATGFPTVSLAAGGAALPSGVTFVDNSNGTGTLFGAPAAGTAGPYALTFTASNGVGSAAVQNFTLTVACPSITLTPAAGALAGGTYQQPYSQTFGAVGGTGHTFTVTAGAPPPGVTLASNGALTGSPTNTGTFNFTVTATDSFLCTGSAAYSIAVIPNAIDESYSGGVGNTQFVVAPSPGSATPAVLVSGTVLSNDIGPGSLSAGPAGIASANGGTVAMGANGAFVYTPAIGFAGPADTFDYTLTDGNGMSDTARVTVNSSGVVWYVNNSGANGDGRSHSPFNALNSAQAPSGVGHVIFVHEGVGATSGAITLKANQTLWGNRHPFSLNSLTIPSAGFPQLSGTITLANGVLVRAVEINVPGGTAVIGSGLTGSETLETVVINGGTTGLSLTNMGGTFIFINGLITGINSGADVLVSGGTGTITIDGVIIDSGGGSVNIQNRTAGTVTFTGSTTDSGTGVLLNANGGSTITFAGGLTLNTGANAAFTATNGGIVNVTGPNNTITTTGGIALTVTNTTIGAGGLTFRSISADGGSNGIVLDNTGALGGLTVTGTGVAGSGGTIQNTSNRGASFGSANNITLRNMNFTNTAIVDLDADNSGLSTGDNLTTNAAIHFQAASGVILDGLNINGSAEQGINGNNVTHFSLANSAIANAGNGPDEDGLHFFNMLGTSVIMNTSITGSGDDNVNIQSQSGTATITVTGSSFNNGVLGSGYVMGIRGTSDTTVTVSGITSTDNVSGGVVIDTFDTATSVIEIANSTITNNNDGIAVSSHNGETRFDIHDNLSFAGNDFARISILKTALSTTGTLQGSIRNNPIVVTDGQAADGISIFQAGDGILTVAVASNDIDYRGTQRAILIQGGQDGSGELNATVTGNTIDLQLDGTGNAATGILAQVAVASPTGDNTNMCVDIGGAGALGNIFTHSLGGIIAAGDIRVRQRFVTAVTLPGYAGLNLDNAAVIAYLAGRNTLVNVPPATATNEVGITPGAGGFIGGGGCTAPIFP